MLNSIVGFFAIFVALGSGAFSQSTRPNIIFLLTDDQRFNTLGAMGDPIIKTPEIDALQKQGVIFDNAYATTAICFASRSTIFSGQHVSRNGFNGFTSIFSATALAETYPLLLRKSGYQTGFIGKWGLGNPLPTSSFDNWYGFAGQGDYEIKANGVVVQHLTSKMGDQAVEFLGTTARSKPFCLSISFKAPHIQDGDPRQFIPDSVDMGLYTSDIFRNPPNSDPTFYNGLPSFLRDTTMELRKRWLLEYKTSAMFQESMKNYYRLISGVDHVVGRLRKKLAEIGADQNTVIVFSSDHGMFIGDRGYAGKWMAYEPSIRVPMIIYDPRLPVEKKGRRFKEMVLNMDIPETILSIAGVAVPAGMQGADMLTLVNGTAKEWRSEFFFDHTFIPNAAPPSQAVVGSRYKYIVYTEQKPPYEELYDLQSDPNESINQIENAKYQAVLDSMRIRFQILKASSATDNVVKEIKSPIFKVTSIAMTESKIKRQSYLNRQTLFSLKSRSYNLLGKLLPEFFNL
jgi:arylsulfatase A-like enzyme